MNVSTPKSFSWSWSRLNNFETCARRYQHYDVLKDIKTPDTQELRDGDDLHAAMRKRVLHGPDTGRLPDEYKYMEGWAQALSGVLHPEQTIQCELKLAIDRNFKPVSFFSDKAWYRGVLDYLRIVPSLQAPGSIAHSIDYKTGKPKEGYIQLALSAQLVFSHYPKVNQIRTDYLWCKVSDTSHENFSRNDMAEVWANTLPRVKRLQHATEANEYPARPNGLCKDYCAVVSCEHWGKRPNANS